MCLGAEEMAVSVDPEVMVSRMRRGLTVVMVAMVEEESLLDTGEMGESEEKEETTRKVGTEGPAAQVALGSRTSCSGNQKQNQEAKETAKHQAPAPATTPAVSGSPGVRAVTEEQEDRGERAVDPAARNTTRNSLPA